MENIFYKTEKRPNSENPSQKMHIYYFLCYGASSMTLVITGVYMGCNVPTPDGGTVVCFNMGTSFFFLFFFP